MLFDLTMKMKKRCEIAKKPCLVLKALLKKNAALSHSFWNKINSENRNLGYNKPKMELTGLLTVKSVIFISIPGA